MVIDVTDRTVSAREKVGEKDLVPKKMRKGIGDQIMTVARNVGQGASSKLPCEACPVEAVPYQNQFMGAAFYRSTKLCVTLFFSIT